MYEFDRTDIKIVNLLLEDGRMSASEISRRMSDISERAVRYRIDRMIDEGVIQINGGFQNGSRKRLQRTNQYLHPNKLIEESVCSARKRNHCRRARKR